MRIVTPKEMDKIEKLTFDEYCMKEDLIIENVGMQVAQKIIQEYLSQNDNLSLVFLIGRGNNGADGLAIARHISNQGFDCRAFMVFSEAECDGEKLTQQIKMASTFGVKITYLEDFDELASYFYQRDSKFVVVDAMFGTGIRLPLPNFIYDIIKFINQNSRIILSIDVPSGISGESGLVKGNGINATKTYAVGLPKVGCYMADGFAHAGEIEVIPAGFPNHLLKKGQYYHLGLNDIIATAKHRNRYGDKKIFGHTLVVGGSHGLTGALVLSSQSVLKVGTGLVTGATWEAQYQEFIPRLIPEVMTGYIPTDETKWDKVLGNFGKYDSVVIGPGMGVSARTRRVVLTILSGYDGPVVIDADAINVLKIGEDSEIFKNRRAPTILTPHMGEFSRLMGVSREEIMKEPLKYIKEAVAKLNASIILKGPCTYMGFPSGQIFFHLFPNDGMATGGSGDVLAGILGGLLAQDTSIKKENSGFEQLISIDSTVTFGVFIHSRAGHFASQNLGKRAMTASSIVNALSNAFEEVNSAVEDF